MAGSRRLLQLGTTWGGGVERVIETLSLGLAEREVDTEIVYANRPAAEAAASNLRSLGLKARTDDGMFFGHEGRTPGIIGRYFRMLRTLSPESVLLHGNTFHVPLPDTLAARLACPRGRLVVLVHHHTDLRLISTKRRILSRMASWFASQLVVTTPIAHDDLIQMGVSEKKIALIPLGVPEPARCPTHQEALDALGLSSQKFVISCVARFDPYKGHAVLLSAVSRLPDDLRRTVHVVMTGTGTELEAVRRQADEELPGQVSFLGHVPDELLPESYAVGDVFCLPSADEGFGLVYVEAAMFGVPSVATHAGGIPYAVSDGRTGLLSISPDDVEGLTAALARLIVDRPLLRSLADTARQSARSKFSADRMVNSYIDLFWPPGDGDHGN